MKQIEAQIEETSSDYDREKLHERKAKLAGGVAVIKVGAGSEVEMKEKLVLKTHCIRHVLRLKKVWYPAVASL